MIVIASSLVLSPAGLGLDHPTFLWKSIVTPSNIASTFGVAEWPAVNLANPTTQYFWRSSSNVEQYLTLTTGTADPIDGIGIARHNFGSAAIAVSVEIDQGGGWQQVIAPFMPGDDSPLLIRLVPASCSALRIKLAAGSMLPQAAVLFVGKLLVSAMTIAAPYTPITMSRVVNAMDGISESGEYLGSIVLGEHRAGNIPIQYIDGDWYREEMDPFIAYAARRGPFFFGWQPATRPTEVGYLRASGDPNVSIHDSGDLISVALSVIGTV